MKGSSIVGEEPEDSVDMHEEGTERVKVQKIKK
jgi:hypothetical protein